MPEVSLEKLDENRAIHRDTALVGKLPRVLKRELHGNLNNSRAARRENSAEIRVRNRSIGIVEIHVIEYIEKLTPELRRHSFSDMKVLDGRQVGIEKPWTAQNVLAGIAERADLVHRKRGSIEPLVNHGCVTFAASHNEIAGGIADKIGAIAAHRAK